MFQRRTTSPCGQHLSIHGCHDLGKSEKTGDAQHRSLANYSRVRHFSPFWFFGGAICKRPLNPVHSCGAVADCLITQTRVKFCSIVRPRSSGVDRGVQAAATIVSIPRECASSRVLGPHFLKRLSTYHRNPCQRIRESCQFPRRTSRHPPLQTDGQRPRHRKPARLSSGTGMTRRGFAKRLKVRAAAVAPTVPSIAGKAVTPHSVRHARALHALEATRDIRKVALWAWARKSADHGNVPAGRPGRQDRGPVGARTAGHSRRKFRGRAGSASGHVSGNPGTILWVENVIRPPPSEDRAESPERFPWKQGSRIGFRCPLAGTIPAANPAHSDRTVLHVRRLHPVSRLVNAWGGCARAFAGAVCAGSGEGARLPADRSLS